MPLTRGRILGYDNERMAFRFSMLDGAESVECQISAAAIDELVIPERLCERRLRREIAADDEPINGRENHTFG